MVINTASEEKTAHVEVLFGVGQQGGGVCQQGQRVGGIGLPSAVARTLVAVTSSAQGGVGVYFGTAIHQVGAVIIPEGMAYAGTHATVVPSLSVFFQHNVDDTSCAFCAEFGRRVGHHFYLINAFGWHLFEHLSLVV